MERSTDGPDDADSPDDQEETDQLAKELNGLTVEDPNNTSDVPSFRVTSEPDGYHIVWPAQPLSFDRWAVICDKIVAEKNYAPYTAEDLRQLGTDTGHLVPLDTYIAIRSIIMKQKISNRYGIIKRQIQRIAAMYRRSDSILELSKKYDYPPLMLLRLILITNGVRASTVNTVFRSKSDGSKLFSARDYAQYKLAEANDAESIFNQQYMAKLAADNEALFITYMRGLGIGLKTQEDLTAEQVSEFGRPIITPDVLFIDPVFINGERVHWIDYKDYIGTNVRLLCNSNREQARRYTEKWGAGAFVFHRSFVAGLHLGAMLLNPPPELVLEK